jgi:hypothetical protein
VNGVNSNRDSILNSETSKRIEETDNTTHGSGWIVQVRPTTEAPRPHPFCYLSPLAPRGERRQNGISGAPLCRLGLNDPPTAVGGIPRSGRDAFVCRLHLNDPPTAVGGIPRSG